jgi:5-methyltetrahydrofolate--homocysteine methyltransferase
MSRFLQALHSGRVLLMDGAMGTELQRAGLKEGECGEHWNLTHPQRVWEIHQSYKQAGAEIFVTNTFQSNPTWFRKHGLENQLEPINHAGAALARSVAGKDGFVLGDIGPSVSDFDPAKFMALSRLARSLAWADALLFETCSILPHTLVATTLTHDLHPEKPILVSFTFRKDSERGLVSFEGRTPPESCAETVHAVHDLGISALGVNCGKEIGMDEIIEIVRRYRQETDLPLFARPNAGTPTRVGDQWVYPRTPEQMAARLPELLAAGVSMVGGCCGTTPAHIAAFRPIVEQWNVRRRKESPDQ